MLKRILLTSILVLGMTGTIQLFAQGPDHGPQHPENQDPSMDQVTSSRADVPFDAPEAKQAPKPFGPRHSDFGPGFGFQPEQWQKKFGQNVPFAPRFDNKVPKMPRPDFVTEDGKINVEKLIDKIKKIDADQDGFICQKERQEALSQFKESFFPAAHSFAFGFQQFSSPKGNPKAKFGDDFSFVPNMNKDNWKKNKETNKDGDCPKKSKKFDGKRPDCQKDCDCPKKSKKFDGKRPDCQKDCDCP
ncbi:MAG: hypothetical protein Q4C95_12245, partial [Planctomycetia bacterium]|nr:hypothetical protein [Planctomycetia bacterium]